MLGKGGGGKALQHNTCRCGTLEGTRDSEIRDLTLVGGIARIGLGRPEIRWNDLR